MRHATVSAKSVITTKKSLIFLHRWMGVALCLIFLLWFVSGIVMMYWDYPGITAGDRLKHLPPLDASRVRLSLMEAYGRLAFKRPPEQVTLSTYDGRPVYRFRMGRQQELIYADNGEMPVEFPPELALRIASQWTGQPGITAKMDLLNEEDQWTVSGSFRALRPLYKYSWPDGNEVYVSQETGEVVQHTTRASRIGAYFGAIPHWLYFTPLRKNGLLWSRVVIWLSGFATLSAFIGLIIGIWMYSPSKRYFHQGSVSSIPYSGQKRLHTILGLFFGSAACTWAFSGMLSLDPFPIIASDDQESVAKLQGALRGGKIRLGEFAAIHPRVLLDQLSSGFKVRELEFTSFAGEPVYIATGIGEERQVLFTGDKALSTSAQEFNRERIIDTIRTAVKPAELTEIRTVTEYEAYYIDRHHRRPLPVLFVRLNDKQKSMYYIDPKTARVVQSYNSGTRWNRWLYQGLHSMDLPWLYKHRPVWDIVVLTLLLGGAWLCVTSVILGWQVLFRKLAARST